MNNSIQTGKLPLAYTSRYFQNLSCDQDSGYTAVITSQKTIDEFFAPRNPSYTKNLKEGKIGLGYELPYPLSMRLALGAASEKPNLNASHLKNFLKKHSALTRLDLRNKCVQAQGATVLKEFLIKNTCLRSLSLVGNYLFDQEITLIAEGLAQNSSLTSLSLGSTCLSNGGTAETLIYNNINQHSTLKSLAINESSSIVMAKDVLNRCPSLTSFIVRCGLFAFSSSLKRMCKALAINTSLKELGLVSMEDRIDSKTVEMLRTAIQENTSLTVLDLSETAMDAKAKAILVQVCEEKKIQVKWKERSLWQRPVEVRGNAVYGVGPGRLFTVGFSR
ncbi:MAG: hypothetical protein H0X26_06750 [Alphaproteobacteria bacterium]|nr:hypothetical protein [Alphaproteobacteria bacterium]